MQKDSNPEEVILTFTGGVQMVIKTSLLKALDVARFLKNDEGGPGTMASPLVSTSANSIQTVVPGALKLGASPLEVLKNAGAKTYPQQITALGYYALERNKSETFDPKEIQLYLRRLGNYPQNFWRDLRHAAHNLGYLYEETPNQYRLTDLGLKNLQSKFEGAIEGLPRKRKVRNKKTK